eukprot:m.190866 g.190866  ORF g.190866 m.190866 type:complete len:535 (+) comp32415_c4_seq1:177-1781(+)
MSKFVLVVLAATLALAQSTPTKPHVWVIVADDLGYGDLGYTGSSVKTPVIDKLAKDGVVLGHYYVMHCCTPTRSALHTGRYPIRFGLQTGVIPNTQAYGVNLTEKLLPQYMKEQGYATHAIGKWHLGLFTYDYTPTYRGYDSFMGYYGGSEDYFTHKNTGIDFHLDIGARCGPNCSQSLLDLRGNYSAPLYADRALTIINEHDASVPLFLYTPYQSVHCPIEAPASYVQPYLHLHPQRQVFAGMLAALDEAIGRVQNAFVEKQMDSNLLIIFSTDNGGPVGSKQGHPSGIGCATGSQNWPLRGGKGAYYQGGVRGTAWVHGPMLHSSLIGTTNFELMHVVDLVPTLVEAAGGVASSSAPHELDGVSQWSTLTAGTKSPRTDLLINIERDHPTTAASPTPGCNGEPQYAVIKGNHKLLVGGGGQPNDWYHDDLPYPNASAPVPEGGCITACSEPKPNGCLATPHYQIFDVIEDESERNNLAVNTTLLQELLQVVYKYNNTAYVQTLSVTTPKESVCPYNDANGSLTPCLKYPPSE